MDYGFVEVDDEWREHDVLAFALRGKIFHLAVHVGAGHVLQIYDDQSALNKLLPRHRRRVTTVFRHWMMDENYGR